MSFTSPGFFALLLGSMAVYYLAPRRWQTPVLLAASLFFYSCAGTGYLFLLLAAIAFGFGMAHWMHRRTGTSRKVLLAVSLAVLLGNLCFFKYYDLFGKQLAGFAAGLGLPVIPPDRGLASPLGISFFTFVLSGYLIDIYRGKYAPERRVVDFALFACFFPLVSSGPIERGNHLLPQLKEEHRFAYEPFCAGASRMLWGFFKKFVVADTIGTAVGAVYGSLHDYTGPYLLLASLLYSYQLYCDFSGYSDIAIGAARMLGIQAAENFTRPFSAGSYHGLWGRWHNTLTGWFREYLYFPLGGSRRGTLRTYLNVLVVFLVSGIWHGSTVNFALWGLLNGVFMVAGRWRAQRFPLPKQRSALRYLWGVACCYLLFTAAIVFFRASTLSDAAYIYTHLLSGWGEVLRAPLSVVPVLKSMNIGRVFFVLVGGGAIACELVEWRAARGGLDTGAWMRRLPTGRRIALYYALALVLALYGQFGASSFIYFQFA